jgi:hypothetical protein
MLRRKNGKRIEDALGEDRFGCRRGKVLGKLLGC